MTLSRIVPVAALHCIAALMSPAAWADNVAHCEILLTQTIANEDGAGEAQIASYRPAVGFLASLYDEETDSYMTEVDGFPIRAVLCRRHDVIPSESDYNILATGTPFILSQDFDSPETDSLTVYWKDGAFDYVYKGQPLSEESQSTLDTRLAEFSDRGIIEIVTAEDEPEETEIAVETDIEAKIEYSSKTEAEMSLVPEAINSAIIEAIGDADISLEYNSETDTAPIVEGKE